MRDCAACRAVHFPLPVSSPKELTFLSGAKPPAAHCLDQTATLRHRELGDRVNARPTSQIEFACRGSLIRLRGANATPPGPAAPMDGTPRSTSSAEPRRRVAVRRLRPGTSQSPPRAPVAARRARVMCLQRHVRAVPAPPRAAARRATHAARCRTRCASASPASRGWRRRGAASARRCPATAPAPTAMAALREHVQPGAGDLAAGQRLMQRREVDHRPAAAIDQHRVRLHPAQARAC